MFGSQITCSVSACYNSSCDETRGKLVTSPEYVATIQVKDWFFTLIIMKNCND